MSYVQGSDEPVPTWPKSSRRTGRNVEIEDQRVPRNLNFRNHSDPTSGDDPDAEVRGPQGRPFYFDELNRRKDESPYDSRGRKVR